MEVHDFLQELPEELRNQWRWIEFDDVRISACPYCSAVVMNARLHLNHSPSCMEALAEANGKWEAEHGVAK